MRNTNKKGFTIVELVVVVAVIAILAAVLIPTFSGVIAKANIATDKKAVNDINTQLAMVEAEYGKPANYGEAVEKLLANGFDIADYKPLAKDYTFYYDKELNKVLYVKGHTDVEFPEAEAKAELKIEESTANLGRWASLSGAVKVADSYTVSGTTATIKTGAELVKVMQDVANKSGNITTVNLEADVDLMGSSDNFGQLQEAGTFTFNGNGHTIYGLKSDDTTYERDGKSYGYGLFGSIRNNTKLVISDLTIKDAVINASKKGVEVGHAGILVGNVTGDGAQSGKINATNITIEGGHVVGQKKAAALVGYIALENATYEDIKFENINISNVTVVGGDRCGLIIANVDSHVDEAKSKACIGAWDIEYTGCTITYDESLDNSSKVENTTEGFWFGGATLVEKKFSDFQ
ncbi:MAG: prepilin-type N-terminal cleavage/methylation domain-containing protein [Ruminococcaceae bacterium]|nr:prepilin-type N-terminal cleavage/methylation domain-containing protein [Oscillospiraceae bacterium]